MRILFADEHLRDLASSFKQLAQKYGTQKAKRIRQRLDELDAASSLADVEALPAVHCQQINGRQYLIAVNTLPDAQLLLKVIHQVHLSEDGTLDWHQVTTVQIISLDGSDYE